MNFAIVTYNKESQHISTEVVDSRHTESYNKALQVHCIGDKMLDRIRLEKIIRFETLDQFDDLIVVSYIYLG